MRSSLGAVGLRIMNIRSIRFRLTLWYSLAFFISTAIIFAAFYVITKQTLLSHTDNRITSHGQAIVSIITASQSTMMFNVFNQGVLAQQFSEMPGMLVIITDSSGEIVASSQAGANDNPVIADLVEKSTGIIKPTFVERTVGTSLLRIGVFPAIKNGNTFGLVFMGDPVEAIYRSLNTLLILLVIVYLLFFVPTIIGSYLLARKAMQPISDISSRLKQVSSQDLNQQVEVPKTGDEISELATTFNDLLQRLHSAFERERQFIGDVAHELKTPLATIRSSVEIATSKDRSKEEYKNVLMEMLVDIDRLSGTLTNVLDLAWSAADQSKKIKETFNLSDLVLELKDLASKMAGGKKIKVMGKVEANIVIFGKRDKLFRAILNVIDNAVKYTPAKGKVEVSLGRLKDFALLTIVDTGAGISSDELPRVFDRFYRGSKTEKVLGSGLGLAIAQAIVSAHGGSISIDSEIGKGTTVVIRLPLKTS